MECMRTMPQVIDYASSRTPWRRQRVEDLSLTVLAILQIVFFAFNFLSAQQHPLIGSFEWSVFAFAWRLTQNEFGMLLFNLALSLMLLSAAIRPAARRERRYQAYFICVLVYAMLFPLGQWYLQTQLPGVWGSALMPGQWPSPLRSAVHDAPSTLVVLLVHPACLVMCFRLVIPKFRFVGK